MDPASPRHEMCVVGRAIPMRRDMAEPVVGWAAVGLSITLDIPIVKPASTIHGFLEPRISTNSVVLYRIQHDVQITLMRLLNQRSNRFFGSQCRMDTPMIRHVIPPSIQGEG